MHDCGNSAQATKNDIFVRQDHYVSGVAGCALRSLQDQSSTAQEHMAQPLHTGPRISRDGTRERHPRAASVCRRSHGADRRHEARGRARTVISRRATGGGKRATWCGTGRRTTHGARPRCVRGRNRAIAPATAQPHACRGCFRRDADLQSARFTRPPRGHCPAVPARRVRGTRRARPMQLRAPRFDTRARAAR